MKKMKNKTICIIEDQVESAWALEALLRKFKNEYNIETHVFIGAKKHNLEYIKQGIIKDTLAANIYLKEGKILDAFEEFKLYYKNNSDEFEKTDLFLVDLRVNGIPGGVFAKDNIVNKGKNEKQVIFYSACIEEDSYYQESLKYYGEEFLNSFYSKLDTPFEQLVDVIKKRLSE